MARQIQITVHLPAALLARVDDAAREEEEAADRLTQTRGHHVARSAMIGVLLEHGLNLGPYGKPPALSPDVDQVLP